MERPQAPPHDYVIAMARKHCAGRPRHLLALDAIDQAWRDSDTDGPIAPTWRQIDYLELAGVAELVPIDQPPGWTRP